MRGTLYAVDKVMSDDDEQPIELVSEGVPEEHEEGVCDETLCSIQSATYDDGSIEEGTDMAG